MFRTLPRRAAVLTAALAALTVSCAPNTPEPHRLVAGAASGPSVPAGDAVLPAETPDAAPADASGAAGNSDAAGTSGAMTPGPELVRDAFAGLQATLYDSCGDPGNCSYFLSRVYEELHGLDEAMKADAKGPGHFPEPIAWIKELDAKLGGDLGFDNLKKHQKLLTGTRDRINTWMQGHPDDYR
ncbi:hypothetical protein ACIQM4_07010 [Streptomyces sp. NPDC091272]|uniref:hypothetical protein n=1 Tax=Streptomyces sp. NPDC091272 TaxID=3365981 RepID=UPI00380F979E